MAKRAESMLRFPHRALLCVGGRSSNPIVQLSSNSTLQVAVGVRCVEDTPPATRLRDSMYDKMSKKRNELTTVRARARRIDNEGHTVLPDSNLEIRHAD